MQEDPERPKKPTEKPPKDIKSLLGVHNKPQKLTWLELTVLGVIADNVVYTDQAVIECYEFVKSFDKLIRVLECAAAFKISLPDAVRKLDMETGNLISSNEF